MINGETKEARCEIVTWEQVAFDSGLEVLVFLLFFFLSPVHVKFRT